MPRRPGRAPRPARRRSGAPTWANSSPRPCRAASSSPVRSSWGAPKELTATSAATVVPSSRTALAEPTAPFRPPARAPVPAPTEPCRTASADATAKASAPSAAVGALANSPPRPRSNSTAAGTIGTTWPGSPIGQPSPAAYSCWTTPSATARPNALPPVSTTALTRSTRLRGSSRSVSRVPGAPPRTSTPATAPASGASTTVQPVSQPSLPPGGMPDPEAGDVGQGVGGARAHQRRSRRVASGRVGPRRGFVGARVDDAEPVAVGVLEHLEVALLVGVVPVLDPTGAQPDEPLDLGLPGRGRRGRGGCGGRAAVWWRPG